jgi:pyrroloquinoline quinone biosynthesis protein B
MTIEAFLLGTAQDGGVPQAGCNCPNCAAAHRDPTLRRLVACLGLVDQGAGQSWLIDATPDLREQVHLLQELAPDCALAGILLTHAHVGHYAGLIHLGREAWNTAGLPLYATARMAAFLRQNAPWSQLVELGNVALHPLVPGEEVRLTPRLGVTPVAVPHRAEFADTLAFVVCGAQRKLLYCPDTDNWDQWERDIRTFVNEMDIALLDATFYRSEELPGRELGQIPHPLAADTAERLAGVDCDVRLIHLNHSNPLHRAGPERAGLAERGIGMGMCSDKWEL